MLSPAFGGQPPVLYARIPEDCHLKFRVMNPAVYDVPGARVV